MKNEAPLVFPSREFDDAVAGACHGTATDGQMQSLHELLRVDGVARDEYLLRVEMHSRLASAPDLFAPVNADATPVTADVVVSHLRSIPAWAWGAALAACLMLIGTVGWALWSRQPASREITTIAVAVLSRAVDAQWYQPGEIHALGGALEPGWLRLKGGLVEVVFHSGARLVLEGPVELRLDSPQEAYCRSGRISAEVPSMAHGFRVVTPLMTVIDQGTAFGLDVNSTRGEVHVFKGRVELQTSASPRISLGENQAAVVDGRSAPRRFAANPSAFATLFELQRRSLAGQERQHERWRAANARLRQDPSLLVLFDFAMSATGESVLPNLAPENPASPDATVVGCQRAEGRWPGKRALEFRTVSDRVRLTVPGEFEALTLSAWVNVKGLDRQFNSLFMADGFEPGEVHWQIRNNGMLDLGVQGPTIRECQIFGSPAVISLDRLGLWIHLAAVLDPKQRQMVHYVNGEPVSRHNLILVPPFRIGSASLGNWDAGRASHLNPSLIRNFSGAMDEFALFRRALSDVEIRNLFLQGKPQPGPETVAMNRSPAP